MINLNLDSFSASQTVKSLAKALQKSPEVTEADEVGVETDKDEQVFGLSLPAGTELLVINSTPQNTWNIHYSQREQSYIRFLFCQQGCISYCVEQQDISFELNRMLSAAINQHSVRTQTLSLPSGEKCSLVVIDIDREQFLTQHKSDNSRSNYFQNLLNTEDGQKRFFRVGYYNLAIADNINQLISNNHSGLVRRVFMYAKVSEILALKIYQLEEEKRQGFSETLLSEEDMKLVIRAKNIHASELKNPPTISELAKRLGTNESKLKRNFKKIYHKTLNESLTEERLNYAKMLLAAQKLNIQQISLEIGYKNPSHFTRLFKQHFGILPRDFLKTLRSTIE